MNSLQKTLPWGSQEETTCCICASKFIGLGNNPYPYTVNATRENPKQPALGYGRCCDPCDETYVLHARLDNVLMEKMLEHCVGCKKAFDRNLQLCGQCKSVFYCSSVCQKQHWKQHKQVCKHLKGQKSVDPNVLQETILTALGKSLMIVDDEQES
jgi:hypothetical protein